MLAPFRACPRTPALWTGVPGFEAILSIDQYPFVYPPGPTLSEGGVVCGAGRFCPCLWLASQPRRACVWECRCPGGYETRASRGRLRAAPFVDMLWGGEALQSGAPPGVAATGLMRQARHSGGCYSITSYHTGNHYNIYYYGALVITWISYVLSVPLSSPGYHMYCRGASVGRPRTLGPRTTYLPLRHYR